MFELRISRKAEKFIKKLKKEYQSEVIDILKEIKEDPLLAKPLSRNLNGKFTYRIRVYRFVYKVNQTDKIVEILYAEHRETVYN
jgi:mRNA-degrading endonuclease RelE of RelBE toxin-antitoxin system